MSKTVKTGSGQPDAEKVSRFLQYVLEFQNQGGSVSGLGIEGEIEDAALALGAEDVKFYGTEIKRVTVVDGVVLK